jgi:hypothetical protein
VYPNLSQINRERFEVFTAVRIMMFFFWVWLRVDFSVDTNVSEKHIVSIFGPEDGGSMFLRNVNTYLRVYTAPKPRRTTSD